MADVSAGNYWRTRAPTSPEVTRTVQKAMAGKRVGKSRTDPKRPGRKGHPEAHYREIAAEYEEFRRLGSPSPTADLANSRNVSRSTAAGWVREARKRGFLAKAIGNRPA